MFYCDDDGAGGFSRDEWLTGILVEWRHRSYMGAGLIPTVETAGLIRHCRWCSTHSAFLSLDWNTVECEWSICVWMWGFMCRGVMGWFCSVCSGWGRLVGSAVRTRNGRGSAHIHAAGSHSTLLVFTHTYVDITLCTHCRHMITCVFQSETGAGASSFSASGHAQETLLLHRLWH